MKVYTHFGSENFNFNSLIKSDVSYEDIRTDNFCDDLKYTCKHMGFTAIKLRQGNCDPMKIFLEECENIFNEVSEYDEFNLNGFELQAIHFIIDSCYIDVRPDSECFFKVVYFLDEMNYVSICFEFSNTDTFSFDSFN